MTDSQSILRDWLQYRSKTNPFRLAIIAGDERLTFRELDRSVDRAAMHLIETGVKPGDRVAIWLPNGASYAVVIHSVSRIGAISVPVNRRLTTGEIAWQMQDAGASWLVVEQESDSDVWQLRNALPNLGVVGVEKRSSDASLSSLRESHGDQDQKWHEDRAIHSIMYTSGTTGRPKGAMLSYGNHWWNAMGSALNLGLRPDDRWLAVLPFFHVGGLSILLRSAIYGITTVIHPAFDPGEVNRSIREDRVTIVSVVSTMLQRMLDDLGDASYPESLRCVLLGGGPAPKPLLDACSERKVPVTQTYGLTETASQLATLAPEEALPKLGSAGKPLYPNEIAIGVDGEWAGTGRPGEILVRGPVVTAGYYQRPKDTEAAVTDGWFRTGDIGYLDSDGYLFVLDRRDDLIVTGGENVYPAEIEAVLSGHSDVSEAAVVGVSDVVWGQRVVAIVCPPAAVSIDVHLLEQHCRTNLAGYKIPTRFIVRNEPLPRNAAGKLLRRSLRDSLERDPGQLC